MTFALLTQLLQQNPSETLWIADENSKPLLVQGVDFRGDLLTNRWDIAKLSEHQTARTFFNDFRIDELSRRYRSVVYPLSKEKAVVHHIINCCPSMLGQGGELKMLGSKRSGIKSYASKSAAYFGSAPQLRKCGSDYISVSLFNSDAELGKTLDGDNYPELRKPPALGGLISKPGQFGWDKVDIGSDLLATQFEQYLPPTGARIVDLGCGYGYLSSRLKKLGNFHITATDNNAAALLACERNFKLLEIEGVVVPSDAGADLEANIADFLVCNPPFHQGFQVEGDLTDRFLKQSARLLCDRGQALFVVNEFIPLARKAKQFYAEVKLLCKAQGFCVYRLTNH
ncbi:methyltransferase [Microbulbifer sp. TYP-18]|uniref:methyltransferase n=1 Tax=Microbulbifer sp. TYP-18 TaxID=3230024 RepID=UPI0034C6DBCB